MVPPLLPALAYGGMTIASALGIANFGWDLYQNVERMKENERYWSDYYKNTGIVPVYPYRAGSYVDYIGTALDASEGIVNLYGKYSRRNNDGY